VPISIEKNRTGLRPTSATCFHRDVRRRAEGEAGLAGAGTGRHHDQVRRLQPEEEVVELVVAGRHAGDVAGAVVQGLELVEGVLQRVGHLDHRFRDPALGDLEHQRLGAVEGVDDLLGVVVAHLGDVARDPDEPAQQRQLVHDLGVVGGVRRRRRGLELQQRLAAAELLEQVGAAQLLGHRDRVDGLALAVEGQHGLVHVGVGRLVEVRRVDVGLDRGGDRVARQQHRPEQ
jgi:hypothetical protein